MTAFNSILMCEQRYDWKHEPTRSYYYVNKGEELLLNHSYEVNKITFLYVKVDTCSPSMLYDSEMNLTCVVVKHILNSGSRSVIVASQ